MSKPVKVKFLGTEQYPHTHSDTSVGTVYNGYVLDIGNSDPHGYRVRYDDELFYLDDKGDGVVSRLAFGWEIVEG